MLSRLATWWNDRRKARARVLMSEREVIVASDDAGTRVAFPSGEVLALSWDEVERIAIETNDSGPWGADVWWVLEGAGQQVAYPQGATGDETMLDALMARFSGFDHQALRVHADAPETGTMRHGWVYTA